MGSQKAATHPVRMAQDRPTVVRAGGKNLEKSKCHPADKCHAELCLRRAGGAGAD